MWTGASYTGKLYTHRYTDTHTHTHTHTPTHTHKHTPTHTHTHPPTQDYIVMSNLDGSLSTSIAISFLYNGLIDLKVLPERAFGTV